MIFDRLANWFGKHVPGRAPAVAVWFLCAALSSATTAGSAAQYSSRLWQIEDGLPHTIVQAITQTRDGYLWVGTREGLARFDGVIFVPIDFPGETAHPSITCLRESGDGTLWIGTEKSGLFSLRDGQLHYHRLRKNGTDDDRITTIEQDRDGGLLIGTGHGLARLQNGKIQFNPELSFNVWSMCQDHDGLIWVAEIGIKCLTDKTVTNYSSPVVVPKSVRTAYCDRDGTLWFGQADGLIRIKNGAVEHFVKGDGLSAMIGAVLKDRKGNVWIGTYGGLNRFVDGKFIPENGNRLAPYRVYAIFEDHEGNIWIGSEGGLVRLTPQYFTTYSSQNGLALDRTISVCESADKGMWIGLWGGGLAHLKDGVITTYTKTNGLSADFVYGILEGRDGSVWIGLDYEFGLDRLKDGVFTHYGLNEGLTGAPVTVIHEDAQRTIWVGTRGGLYHWNGNEFSRLNALPQREINDLCEDSAGGIWIGTERGLIHRATNGVLTAVTANGTRFKNSIFSIYEDAEKTLWVGTKGNGLKRFKNGRYNSYTSKEGLGSDTIYGILEDGRQNLWFSSSKGIFRVAKKEFETVATGESAVLAPVKYGKIDGIVNNGQFPDAVQPAAWKSSDGKLWFRTIQGVAMVDPQTIITNHVPPPVMIEFIVADKKTLVSQSAATANLFAIPPGRGELEIHFSALSFRDPQKNRFKYKLEGWDLDWVEAGGRRVAYYNNLPPRNYKFRVLASNNDGIWNKTGASVGLYLEPHYWQTWWFRALCFIIAVAAVAGMARYVTRQKMRREFERLERQRDLERERSRIARDIHDDLGARVTHITLLSESFEEENREETRANTRKIGAACREMAQSLDEIVWAVNPAHDTLEGLVEYLSQSADEFLEKTDIRLRLNLPREIPPRMISTEVRYQLFLAFREALNNAVKHAGATEIQIDLSVADAQLRVVISDNGGGFAVDSPDPGGNGLGNMRRRLEAIGGQFEILSQPGAGATVRLTITLNTPQMCG